MEDFSNLMIAGVPLLMLIFGLVEFIKKFNVKGEWLTFASMLIGVVLGVGYQLAQMYPQFGTWAGVVAFSIALGLAASGIYNFGNQRWPKVQG